MIEQTLACNFTRYHDILRPLFVEIDSGNIEAITSTITLLEVLTPMNARQIKITAKEIQDLLPTLSGSEILELDRKIHQYLETMAYSKAAETAFSEWNDPEEGIYDET